MDELVRPVSVHFGPADVLLTLASAFRPGLSAAQAAVAIGRPDEAIRAAHRRSGICSWKPRRSPKWPKPVRDGLHG
jgi:hypothetical protein